MHSKRDPACCARLVSNGKTSAGISLDATDPAAATPGPPTIATADDNAPTGLCVPKPVGFRAQRGVAILLTVDPRASGQPSFVARCLIRAVILPMPPAVTCHKSARVRRW